MSGGLTPQGIKKLTGLNTVVRQMPMIFFGEMDTLKDKIVDNTKNVYPEHIEKEVLMRGVAWGGGAGTGMYIGSEEGGRCIGYRPLYNLIQEEKLYMRSEGDNVTVVEGIDPNVISAKARFRYRRRSGAEFEANPFHGRYFDAVEDGGLVWNVEPRSDNRGHILEPENGVFAQHMTKTVAAKHMVKSVVYGNSVKAFAKRMLITIRQRLKQYGVA